MKLGPNQSAVDCGRFKARLLQRAHALGHSNERLRETVVDDIARLEPDFSPPGLTAINKPLKESK